MGPENSCKDYSISNLQQPREACINYDEIQNLITKKRTQTKPEEFLLTCLT